MVLSPTARRNLELMLLGACISGDKGISKKILVALPRGAFQFEQQEIFNAVRDNDPKMVVSLLGLSPQKGMSPIETIIDIIQEDNDKQRCRAIVKGFASSKGLESIEELKARLKDALEELENG